MNWDAMYSLTIFGGPKLQGMVDDVHDVREQLLNRVTDGASARRREDPRVQHALQQSRELRLRGQFARLEGNEYVGRRDALLVGDPL